MSNESTSDAATMRPAFLFEEREDCGPRADHSSGSLPASPPAKRSLVIASLDIGRVLADRDGVTFRAKGTCMYPTIRAGDVLRIQSRTAADVLVGEIVVFRRTNYLFSHRVIALGCSEGRAYVVTRPDGARDGSDAPTFDEGLLGVVVAIERKGKRVPLLPQSYPWLVRSIFALRLALIKSGPVAHLRWTELLASLQSSGLYRRMARTCLTLTRPRISYTVRLPTPALGDAVYRVMALEVFDLRSDWRGRPVKRWTLLLHINGAPQPAAWARFARDIAEDWRLEEWFVRACYRGTGLKETLLQQADTILQRTSFAVEASGESLPAASSA